MAKIFYFVDTRPNAKSDKPFGISNADVAKVWTKDFNNGEGPFKPVGDPEEFFPVNRRDLVKADQNDQEDQEGATEHNAQLVDDGSTPYDDMTKEELQGELEAREIDFKKSGPESTNAFYIKQLVADDNK